MAEPKLRFKKYTEPLKAYRIGDIYTERKEHGDDSLPMLTVSIHSGVSDGELEEDDLGKHVARSEDKTKYKRAEADDIVFNMMRAWQGAIGVVRTTGMVSPAYIVAKPNDLVYPLFMDYYMKTPQMINKINRLSYGLMDFRKRLYWDSFVTIDCLLPSIEEQRDIVSVFEAIDDLVVTIEKDIKLWEEKRRVLMQKIFTKEVRFKDENGKELPKWEEKSINECVIKAQSGGTPKASQKEYYENGEIPFLSIGDITYQGKYVASTIKRITQLGLDNSSSWIVPKGTILLTMYGSYGKPCILSSDIAISQAMIALISNENIITSEYFYQILSYYEINGFWKKYVKKGSQPNISAEIVKNARIPIPNIAEQLKIVGFLSAVDEVLDIKKQKLGMCNKIKQGLLQQLFV